MVITNTKVEPIVPLGCLDRIHCEISWKNGAMRARLDVLRFPKS